MVHIFQGYSLADRRVASMFEDRKRLFVDTMRWNVPVLDGRYEIDRFDGCDAVYLVMLDAHGEHIGSMRLLPTTTPHILGNIFPQLCDGTVPSAADIWEITRLCLPCRLGAEGRLAIRNRLISAMMEYALTRGIRSLTGVVASRFLQQIRTMGWRCAPLGASTVIDGKTLGAFRIEIDAETPALLARTGIYAPSAIARARNAA